MPTEGVIVITLKSDETSIYLTIEDDGCGIEQETLETIFNPFMSTKEHGDGLVYTWLA